MTPEQQYLEAMRVCGMDPEPVDYMSDRGFRSYDMIGDDHAYIVFYADTGICSFIVHKSGPENDDV